MAISFPFASSLISSGYGNRTWNGVQTFHTGVDFALAGGRAVAAADSGTVTRVEYTHLKGYQVEVTHSSAAKTRYHMLRNDVSSTVTEGQSVFKGQTIGYIAPVKYNSAAAWTGPHLHFEVWLRSWSSSGASGAWFHHNPRNSVSNAGGPNGYSPSEPTGTGPATGGSTPINPPNESDDMEITELYNWRRGFSDNNQYNLLDAMARVDARQEAINARNETLVAEVKALVNGVPWKTMIDTRVGGNNIFERIQHVENKVGIQLTEAQITALATGIAQALPASNLTEAQVKNAVKVALREGSGN